MQRTQTNPRAETVPVIRVVVAKEGGMTSSYELTSAKVQFGRSPDCEVRLEGKNISRVHAWLEVREGNLWVHDNDSLNGIFVNGEKVKSAILTARDGVKVGPYRFKAIVTGTAQVSAPARAAVPASAPREEDRTLPVIETKSLTRDPLPKEEEPLRARTSSSAGPILEEFIPVTKGTLPTAAEDQTPADGAPVASPAQALRPAAPAPAPAPVKAEAPVAKPSYRSTFEKQTNELPKAEAKSEAPAAPAAPRMPVATRGRMSLTNPGVGAKKNTAALKAGDLCPSCSTGRMLTWQGALKCRNSACGNEAQIGDKPSFEKSEKTISAKAPVAKAPAVSVESDEAPVAKTSGEVLPGELCGSCFKGKMLTWEGSLKCRSCGNTAEIPASFKSGATKSIAKSNARPSISARPSITPASRPAAPSAPLASRPAPVAARPAAPSLRTKSSGIAAGDLCDACSKGRMLTWEGSLKCRSCGNTAELGSASSVSAKAERLEAPVARTESRVESTGDIREPNRTAAAITGVGLFIALYATVGLSWLVQSIFVVATTPSTNFNF